MPHKTPTLAPFALGPGEIRWIYDSAGRQLRIVGITRRHVTVTDGPACVRLRRRRLEREGADRVGGLTFYISRYVKEGTP